MQGTVAEAIERATLEVFALMVGVDIVPEIPPPASRKSSESSVVSSFRLSGAVCGTAEVHYTLPLATRVTCKMLQVDPPVAVNEVLDAAGEVANMIVGNVKNSLESRGGVIRIGTPTVSLAGDEGTVTHSMRVSFRCCDEVFTVSVAFQEDPRRWEN